MDSLIELFKRGSSDQLASLFGGFPVLSPRDFRDSLSIQAELTASRVGET